MRANERLRIYLQWFFLIVALATIVVMFYNYYAKRNAGEIQGVVPGTKLEQRTDYYPDGKIRAQGYVSSIQKEGKWLYYDREGNVELIETYVNGNVISSVKVNENNQK